MENLQCGLIGCALGGGEGVTELTATFGPNTTDVGDATARLTFGNQGDLAAFIANARLVVDDADGQLSGGSYVLPACADGSPDPADCQDDLLNDSIVYNGVELPMASEGVL
jgi:hypothetical protein